MKKKYLSFLYKIIINKISISFSNPKKNSLVLLDGTSHDDLQNVLNGLAYTILEVRPEKIKKIYFSPKIVIHYFINVFKIFIKKNRNVSTIYFYTLLKLIKPKVVFTFIDNSEKFFDLAKLLESEIIFLAIQNAARYDFVRNNFALENKLIKIDRNKKFYIPHYICFGDVEEDLSKEFNINIKNFYKFGSLRLANFYEHLKDNKIKLRKFRYDLCLIGEPAFDANKTYNVPTIENGFANLAKYAVKFSIKHNLKFIFAKKRFKGTARYGPAYHDDDYNFYKKYLNNSEMQYFEKNTCERSKFSSYKAIFESSVAVATQSTLLREKIGCDEKILSVNLTNSNFNDFPMDGICKINNCSYEEFEERLLKILNLSKSEYFNQISKDKNYVMTFSETKNTIEKINEKINFFLSD